MNDQRWYEAAAHDPDHPPHLAAADAPIEADGEAECAACVDELVVGWKAGRPKSTRTRERGRV